MKTMPTDPTDIEAIALLDDPVRRRLYDWVVHAGRAVSRDEAAGAAEVSRALAAFHLDRLADAGLLTTEYRRLSGRTGPGAGRPAKLYRRGSREVTVSLPDRDYEVPARLFAATIERLGEAIPPDALRDAAHETGEAIGAAARAGTGPRPGRRRLREALELALAARGYDPVQLDTGEIRFRNCPFHALVDEHRDLVCGMNLALAEGIVAGVGVGVEARLDPQPGHCCVAIRPGGPG
jgi:predicted ArsR family transcriptional regulator